MSKFTRSCLSSCRRVLDCRLRPEAFLGPNQWYRKNGFSLPLHPFQVIAWILLSIFVSLYYLALIPNVQDHNVRLVLIVLMSISLGVHLVAHWVSSAINPADYNVLAKNFQGRGTFDRAQHKHVIENQYCYICETKVGAKSKHCSACNKCIGEFDHHCKWLNNCVGVQNYRWFVVCVMTALICSLVILGLSFYLLHNHCVFLRTLKEASSKNCTETETSRKCTIAILTEERYLAHVAIDYGFYLFVLVITLVLALLAVALLAHLLAFHMFLWKKKMSTYEYIVSKRDAQRQQQDQLGYAEQTVCFIFKRKRKVNQVRPSSLANVEDTIHPDSEQPPNQQFDLEKVDKENLARKASSSHSQVSRMASNKSHTSSVITHEDLKRKGSFAAGDVYIGTPTAEVIVADEMSRRSGSLHRQGSLQRQDSLQHQDSLPRDPDNDRPDSFEGSRSGRSVSQLSLNKIQDLPNESTHLPIEADVVICTGDNSQSSLKKADSMVNLLPQNSTDTLNDDEQLHPSTSSKRRNHDSGYSEKTKHSSTEELDSSEGRDDRRDVDPMVVKAMEQAILRPQSLPVKVSPLVGNNLSPVNA